MINWAVLARALCLKGSKQFAACLVPHRNKKGLLMIPMLISNQCLTSLLSPRFPLLSVLVRKHFTQEIHQNVPAPNELWCPGETTNVTGMFSSSFWRQRLKVISLNYFSELLPCKAILFVHWGLGALGRELFLKWGQCKRGMQELKLQMLLFAK